VKERILKKSGEWRLKIGEWRVEDDESEMYRVNGKQ
jgi:hypothetical protein